MYDLDVTVVGGGIVGCAVAAAASRRGLTVVLLEKEDGLARGITSRNSEVAHGGMYYPQGSNKASYCVRGRRLLKEFCLSHDVGYREYGKLIVALNPGELEELERLLDLGQGNGVEDLQLIDGPQLAQLEPDISALAALHSPRTGVLDAEGAARAYAGVAREHGAQVMTGAQVTGLDRQDGAWKVRVEAAGDRRDEGWTHRSRWVVNAAGLSADMVAELAGIDVGQRQWRQIPVKGNYFRLAPEHAGRIRHLVYPVPPADGSSLGVHICLDLQGQLKLGPDLEEPQQGSKSITGQGDGGDIPLDYLVDPRRRDSFFESAVQFLPWLKREDLSEDMAGFRPKLAVQGFHDFVLHPETGELEGLINLIGIDSPGLTSAAALAQDIGKILRGESVCGL